MRPITVSVGPLTTADDNGICKSQKPNAGELDLDGDLVTSGVAILPEARRVYITSDDDDTVNVFTVTGTGYNGEVISEEIVGPDSAAVYTVLDYKTVTSVSIDGNAVGNLLVGTGDVASSRWVRLDEYAPAQSAVQVNVDGTVNYSVETTLQNPTVTTPSIALADVVWLEALDANLVSESTKKSGFFAYTPVFAKLTLNSGTGSATAIFAQSSSVPK